VHGVAQFQTLGLMRALIALIVALALSGCIPLRQQETISGGHDSDFLLCDDSFLLAQFNPSNQPNRCKVIPAESYILSPSGKRYNVQVEPHQFDIEQKYTCVRERIYPIDAHGQRLKHWYNGIWIVHVALDAPNQKSILEEKIRFWTFFYNPLIHGPPN